MEESKNNGYIMNEDKIGGINQGDIICNDCQLILINKGKATKLKLPSYLSYDNERDFEPLMDYWRLSKMADFNNIQVYSREGNVEFLSCIRCDTRVIGIIFNKSERKEIYLSCNRTSII